MTEGKLQQDPKSKMLKKGYINVYSELNEKESRQIYFRELYKKRNPKWDETQVFLSRWFEEYAPENCDVLDAGCGNGNYVIDENRKKISWAIGVDISEDFVKKNICLDEIKISNLEHLPLPSSSIDVVISLWVFEHLENPKKVFSEVHRVLKPDGHFIFATPNSKFMPLAVLRLLNATKMNYFLNRVLFGRKKEDIFEAFYRANTLEKLKYQLKDKFIIDILRLNYDPSYTSFDKTSFFLSNTIHNTFLKLGFALTFPHILGILQKR